MRGAFVFKSYEDIDEKGRSVLEWIERVILLCEALNCQPRDLIDYVDAEKTGINGDNEDDQTQSK